MRNLLLSTAMALPLMLAPAFGQDTAAPADATAPAASDPAAGAAATPDAGTGTDAGAAVEADAAAGSDAADTAAIAASGKVEQQQAENEMRIDWITDATVMSPDGTAIGDINDVIVDADAGTIKAAVIGVGGFLGIGEKQIAVPWDQLTLDHDAQQITSDLTRDEANAAPEYVFRPQAEPPAAADSAVAPMDGTATAPAVTDGTAPAGTDGTSEPLVTDGTAETAAQTGEAPVDPASSGSGDTMGNPMTTTTDPAAATDTAPAAGTEGGGDAEVSGIPGAAPGAPADVAIPEPGVEAEVGGAGNAEGGAEPADPEPAPAN